MLKGKIIGVIPKTWGDRKFWEFQIENNEKVFTCWQDIFATKKVGDEVEFEAVQTDKGWKATFPSGKGGYGYSRGKSPEEIALQKKAFALAYAKDQSGWILNFLKDKVKIPENLNFTDSYKFIAVAITHLTVTIAKDYEAFLDKKTTHPIAPTAQTQNPAGYPEQQKEPEDKPPWA